MNKMFRKKPSKTELMDQLEVQIENLEKEQLRLEALAEEELTSKGIFGWLWK